jgi:hypothetical protein
MFIQRRAIAVVLLAWAALSTLDPRTTIAQSVGPNDIRSQLGVGTANRGNNGAAEKPPANWVISIPGERQIRRQNLRPAAALVKSFYDTAALRYHREDNTKGFTGIFRFWYNAKDKGFELDGLGLTMFPDNSIRSFNTFDKGDREGDFVQLEEGEPFLIATYHNNKLHGLACFCVDGAPKVVQKFQNGVLVKGFLVVDGMPDLTGKSEVDLDTDDKNRYLSFADELRHLLDKAEEENKTRLLAFKKWAREEAQRQRSVTARKRSAEKSQEMTERIESQSAEAAQNFAAAQKSLDRLLPRF